MSQANTIEMIGPNGGPVFPPIGDEKGSYTTYDTGDFTDDYSARFDVSRKKMFMYFAYRSKKMFVSCNGQKKE